MTTRKTKAKRNDVDLKACRKTQGRAEEGNNCLQTPGTCESCPDWVKPVSPQYFLQIEDVPRSLNAVLTMHWRIRHNYFNTWNSYVRAQKHWSVLRKAKGKRKVKIVLHHARIYDKDNAYGACKPLIDALKNWKLILDDSAKWLELTIEQVTHPHKSRYTTILIEGETK